MRMTSTPRAAAAHREGTGRLFSRGGRWVESAHRMGLAVSLVTDGGSGFLVRGGVAGDWNGACEWGSGSVAA